MDTNIEVGLHNEFEIVVRDSVSGKEKKRVKGYNIILNRFWSLFIDTGITFSHIHIGSGTTTPLPANTGLTTSILARSCSSQTIDTSKYASDGIIAHKRSIRIQDTEFIGASISEVGIGNSSTSVLTKCLLKDNNGHPITIIKGESEIIDIYATFFAKFPMEYVNCTGDVCIGIASDALQRGCSLQASVNSSCRAYYSPYQIQPNCLEYYWMSYASYAGNSVVTKDSANKKITHAIPNVNADAMNVGGLRTVFLSNELAVKIKPGTFTQSPLIKEVIGTGDGANKQFNTKFGLIKNDSDFKVYVNDVEVSTSEVLFDTIIPQANVLPQIKYLDWSRTLQQVPFLSSFGDSTPMGVSDVIFENPLYAYGVTSAYGNASDRYDLNCPLYTSDSPTGPWTKVPVSPIAAEHRYKRYWKHTGAGYRFRGLESSAFAAKKLITLTDAPASGAVVSCSYNPDLIAKDTNHVIHNAKVEITFNEYTPT